MSNDNGEQGSINLDDTKDIDTDLEGMEDPKFLKEHAEKTKKFAKQAIARAKKAETELKALKDNPPLKDDKSSDASSNINKPVLTPEDVDIKILRAQKVSEEEITYLKKVAVLNSTSIIEAQTDELYLAWKEKREAAAKAQKANLANSNRSGAVKKEKDFTSPGLSDAEHKEMWKQNRDA